MRKTRFSQNPLNPQFWALGFWIYTSSCANLKKMLRDIFNESHCMFLPLVAILSIGLDKMLLSGNNGKNKKKVNKDDDSQWEVWGRLPPAQLCLNLGLPTLRSVRVSVLSFHFIHLLHIFSYFFLFLSLLFPYFLNFHIFSESHCLFLRESGKPKVLLYTGCFLFILPNFQHQNWKWVAANKGGNFQIKKGFRCLSKFFAFCYWRSRG